jgi:hypothetical protein
MGIRDPAEVATKRLRNASNYVRKKSVGSSYAFERFLPRDIALGRPFLRVYIEAFLTRFAPRFHARSSFAPQKTYTLKKKLPPCTVPANSTKEILLKIHYFHVLTNLLKLKFHTDSKNNLKTFDAISKGSKSFG